VSLEFLSPSPGALARSPMERDAEAAGARLELRAGWHVAVEFDGPEAERERCATTVGFADLSHLGKLEVQGGAEDVAALVDARGGGLATRANGAWLCSYTPARALVLCETDVLAATRAGLERAAAEHTAPTSVLDVTTTHGALVIVGPLARELFARFTAIDLRPEVTPVHGWRPGSVARTPGAILRESEDRYLMLFGAALGHYVWTTVADAAASLGGGPVGTNALAPIAEELLHA
jgi:heterotetrameric sarcosine oxidase gamma subunit